MKGACILALGFLALGGTASADMKIAFVNTEVILQQYKAVQGVMETFNRDVQGWDTDLQQKKRELDGLQKEVQQQGLMLSDQRRQEKELEYQRRLTEFEKLKESIWGSDGLIEQRNEELFRPVISKVQSVLEQIAAEDGYDLILDAADNNILYGDPTYDLTTRVIGILNGEETTPGTTPAPAPADGSNPDATPPVDQQTHQE
jgi:outer membrane protein